MEAEGERFGPFGGRYVPETLISALDELDAAYEEAVADSTFREELDLLLRDYVGRPSPLYRALRLEAHVNGAPIFLKREDLNHTGAHKINNTLGQVVLARQALIRDNLYSSLIRKCIRQFESHAFAWIN